MFLTVTMAAAITTPTNNKIKWDGITWDCKYGSGMGPGNNYWSASGNNVWIDDQNRLHLTIKKTGTKWYCTEVQSQKLYKYGTFKWKISSPIFTFDKNSVLGLFTYVDDNHEIDIETTRWQQNSNNLLWYTVQPCDITGNSVGFLQSTKTTYDGHDMTVQFDWQPTYVHFTSWDNTGKVIADMNYTGASVPHVGQKLMMNLWLRAPPSNRRNIECIITSVSAQVV